ncbi:MAG: efflux RND transporter permease subunit, partial [Planctomycetota bacterium]|nr:efflux RND transporter permease subunit [Planctomycetota bacterium]
LVFVILALFLELKLAFWVALGIPISLLGACIVLLQFDQTLNMLSLFSFLIALGIVVDDAIVIGENVYAHQQMGKSPMQAALDGTIEVVPSVFSSVTTTVFAFMPMFFVTGIMGKFFAVMPLAVIAILVISLIEASMVLPSHLAHGNGRPSPLTAGLNRFTNFVLNAFISWIYRPVVVFCVRNPAMTLSSAVSILLLTASLVSSGKVPSIFFPKLDAPEVMATVIFPDGTPSRFAEAATLRIENAIQAINAEHSTEKHPLVLVTHRMVGLVTEQGAPGGGQRTEGSHAGSVYAQLVDSGARGLTSDEIVQEWRLKVGPIAGVETLTFGSQSRGPGGKPIEFKLLAPAKNMDQLEKAIEETKQKLVTYQGVFDVADDSRPGKWELQLREKPNAVAMGVPLESIARTVRASYYGEEVMRLQRGRHEVKLMVRYPEEDRKSLARFDDIRVDVGDGVQRPITELAEVKPSRGYSEINRIDQMRSITISCDINEKEGNAKLIVQSLQGGELNPLERLAETVRVFFGGEPAKATIPFMPELLKKYPAVRVRWEGQQEQDTESVRSLGIGLGVALIAMYVLLTVEFTSYGQPIVVMAVIPFGIVGAILGHWCLGLPLTLFSILGLVALTGVVVNDSIVLVDFINSSVRSGVPLHQAVVEAGQRRFRPVMLTSLTTIAGLSPILAETSFQAQLVIPMAASLCFGLMTSTVLVLILVPTFYNLYANIFGVSVAGKAPELPDEATSV